MLTRLAAILLPLLVAITPAHAGLSVVIDLSAQRMSVRGAGAAYDWPVSTARRGYRTPTGTFRPQALERMHYSSLYDNAPMPHSIFFRGNYAIHGTNHIKSLGRPASHGCVRLAPGNARVLFDLVRGVGMGNVTIRIVP